MKKIKLFITLFVIILFVSTVSAQSTRIKIVSKINPKYIIEEIKSKPYILYFTIGKFYFKINNYEKSLNMFEKAIKLKPDFAPAHFNLGVVYYKKAEYNNAIMEFKKAIKLDESYTLAHYSLALLYFELQDFDNAIDSFSNAINLEPNNPNYNFDLAQAYVAKFRQAEQNNTQNYEDLNSALFYFNKTYGLQPSFPYVLNNIKVLQSIIKARKNLLITS